MSAAATPTDAAPAPRERPDAELDGFLTPTGALGARTAAALAGTHLGDFDDFDAAERALARAMTATGWYPNAWLVDDHGGATHLAIEAA